MLRVPPFFTQTNEGTLVRHTSLLIWVRFFICGDGIIHTLSISIPPIEEDFSRKPFLKVLWFFFFFMTLSICSLPDHYSEYPKSAQFEVVYLVINI